MNYDYISAIMYIMYTYGIEQYLSFKGLEHHRDFSRILNFCYLGQKAMVYQQLAKTLKSLKKIKETPYDFLFCFKKTFILYESFHTNSNKIATLKNSSHETRLSTL